MFKLLIVATLIFLSFARPAFAFEKASASSAKIRTVSDGGASDLRVKIIQDYLKQFDSPLVPYSSNFVKYADEYDLDYRLVVSISGVESTFGRQIPYNSYNGWGWGIFGSNVKYFASWDEGIKTVSQGLRENYIDEWGASNVYEIGRFYAASPTWAQRVEYFMKTIQDFELRSPQSALSLSI